MTMVPFVGVASAEVVDLDGDVIVAAGLSWPYWNRARTIYRDHSYNSDDAVGRMLSVHRDTRFKRLVLNFEIDDATQTGRDTISKIQAGIIRGLSIGFRALDAAPPTKEEAKRWPGVRQVIHRAEVMECSVTPMPCNPDALIGLDALRSIGKPLDIGGDSLSKRAAWEGLRRMTPFPKRTINLTIQPAKKIVLLTTED